MYRVAIVEDEWESFESIRKCFEEYTKEYGEAFNIIRFKNGMYFLGAYSSNFDVVIMDIDMPQMNGINEWGRMRARICPRRARWGARSGNGWKICIIL